MKKKIIILISVLILICLGVTIYSKTYSKYTSSSVWNYYLKSQNFYFESDDLALTPKIHNDTNWTGDAITFNLKNSKNSSLITDVDINYEVECNVIDNPNLVCKINDQDKFIGTMSSYKTCVNNTGDGVDTSAYSKTDCELNGYSYDVIESKQDLSFEIIPLDGNYNFKDVKVSVVATSTAPYAKTISANYNLIKNDSKVGKIDHEYNSYDDYSKLVVTNSFDEEKVIQINFDESTKRIDLNTEGIEVLSENNNYVNSIKVRILPNKSKTIVFYDINDKIDNFEIIELTN